ncbi:MAG: toll/interleukin-1 receptor domain-containing protein [Pseudomonadota bacterium]
MKMFLSYRRRDSGGISGRLYDRLIADPRIGEVFIDVDAIAAGEDFVKRMLDAVAASDTVLVLIGSGWTGGGTENRLTNPDDAVRLEVEAAFDANKRIIPVLVDDAPMPSRDDLPASLQRLVTLNAVALRHNTFDTDLLALFQALGMDSGPPRRSLLGRLLRLGLGSLGGAVVCLLVALANKSLTGRSLEATLGSSEAVVVLMMVTVMGGAVLALRR